MELFINGKKMDLPDEFAVAKTLQVNDIGTLSTRETNFTSKISLPLTSNNRAAFEFLGSNGNQSNIPYQKNIGTLLNNAGESLIYNGWAEVDKTSKNYELVMLDGIVDFYKFIENKNLTDVGLGDLNHLKNLENVVESFSADTPYRYIVADYNGKVFFQPSGSTSGSTVLNIDYLIPSAHVPFIWDKVFEYAGYTYEGQVFETEAFQNLWLTYPKPVPSTSQAVNLFNTQNFTGQLTYVVEMPTENNGIFFATYYESTLLQDCFTTTGATSVAQTDGNCRVLEVDENGLYRFTLNGSVTFPNNPNANFAISLFRLNTVTNTYTYETIIENLEGFTLLDNISYSFTMTDTERVGLHFMNLQFGNLPYVTNNYWQPDQQITGNITIQFLEVLGDVVNFDDALIDFKIKDFINEITQRFCLTMYRDKYSKKITFLTLGELLQTNNIERWDEDIEIIEEEYTYGNYAQRNHFVYRYNEENDSTFDGSIVITNPNLEAENTVITSKFYAPEVLPFRTIQDFNSKVYKFWNREVKTVDDQDGNETTAVEYKPLDKRFYLLRSEPHTFAFPMIIGSEVFGQTQTITTSQVVPIENYYRLSMKDIIEDFYTPMAGILNRSKMIMVNKFFQPKEVVDFDFRKLIYIDKLGEYYIPNKVSDWIEGRPCKTELVNVKFFTTQEQIDNGGGTPIDPIAELEITNITQDGCEMTIEFETDAPKPFLLYLTGVPVFLGNTVGNTYWIEEGTTSITFTVDGIVGFYNWTLSISQVGIVANSPNYNFLVSAC